MISKTTKVTAIKNISTKTQRTDSQIWHTKFERSNEANNINLVFKTTEITPIQKKNEYSTKIERYDSKIWHTKVSKIKLSK
jgi:HD superfamily phosphohydrolase YqeK